MSQEKSLPTGLFFYWYEPEQSEKHPHYWGQLCGSTHRLKFLCEELNAINKISDINEALPRLEYHMENYLHRIYELRERIVKLLKAFSRTGDIGTPKVREKRKDEVESIERLKGKDTRKNEVEKILPNNPDICSQYLDLLSLLDDDIKLRNQNTHDTFLSLGYRTDFDIYKFDELLAELESQSIKYDEFVQKLKEAINEKIHFYESKINKIIELAKSLLEKMDFVGV